MGVPSGEVRGGSRVGVEDEVEDGVAAWLRGAALASVVAGLRDAVGVLLAGAVEAGLAAGLEAGLAVGLEAGFAAGFAALPVGWRPVWAVDERMAAGPSIRSLDCVGAHLRQPRRRD